MLPNIDSNHIKNENFSISHLRTFLTIAADREDNITITRVFILFMMGYLWFQTANNTYWLYEYCGVGHPIVKEDVKYLAYPRLKAWERGNRKKTNDQADNLFMLGRYHIDHRTIETITWRPWLEYAVSELDDLTDTTGIPLDPPLNMSPHLSPANLQAMRQTDFAVCTLLTDSQRMGNIDLFGPSALRAGTTPVVVASASVQSLSQDFSLPGEPEGPDPGWLMEWIGRRGLLPIHRLRDLPEMSPSYGAEELWYLIHVMR
ncbi:hypothetical protein GIB67_040646 [Kingdonia uniflora]|uniref:Uncharacterized protein n=1 Tax=Kingdonia uniflora TaxID=39325 RepID=A0A7J7KU59_9MAGN|nr:hypothetical protein GIB67_040646 [Kingdonia uniflora]